MQSVSKARWAMALQTLIAALGFSFARNAAHDFDTLVLPLVRMGGSAMIFAIIFFSRGGFKGNFPTKREWIKLIVLAFIGITMGQFLFLYGLKYTTPANSAVLYAMTPLWVLSIAVFITKSERLSAIKIIGITIAISGGLIVMLGGGKTISFAKDVLFGNLLTLGAVWCWALYLVYGRRVLGKYDPIQGTALMMMLGAVLFLPIGIIPSLNFDWQSVSMQGWIGALYVTLLASVIAYGLITYAMGKLAASQISVFMNAQPAIAALFSMMFLGESLTWNLIVGGAMTVAGIVTLQRAPITR